MSSDLANRLRFGPFELDLQTRELWKSGVEVKLVGQPFEILAALLTRPGKLVTREELKSRLWAEDTFVDFDHGLNAAVNKLREAIGDSKDSPEYIQTLPRLGYRFIGSVSTPASDKQEDTPAPSRRKWRLVAAATALLALVGAGIYVLRHRPDLSPTMAAVPLTTYPGTELAPSFSPDGNEVAFECFELSTPTQADLYVKQVGQEHAIRLTNHKAKFIEPAWSPDGKSLAFLMLKDDGLGVYVMPALGGPERHLASLAGPYPFSRLSWSADSEWVAFAKLDEPSDAPRRYRIHLLSVHTGEERLFPLSSPDCAMSLHPAFSFDGKYLASTCELVGGAGHKIYIQNFDGSSAREIVHVASPIMSLDGLAWTADGRFLIYSADGKLWRVPAKGGTAEAIPFADNAIMPAVSATGRLAFARGSADRKLWSIKLATATKAAGPPKPFAPTTRLEWQPHFSPDGTRVVFGSDRSGNIEIWLADRDGSNPVQLTFFASRSGTPRWSADSQSIFFDSLVSGTSKIFTVSANGGQPRMLATGTPNAAHPFCSQDGHWIYFTTEKPRAVWKIPSAGGAAIRLTKEGGYYPQESADGKFVFYVAGEQARELWSVTVNGGDEHRVKGIPGLALDATWTPVENGIYFVDGAPRHYSLFYFEFATQGVRKVTQLPDLSVHPGLAVSPDGHQLLYSGIEGSESDLVLVDKFH